MTITEFQGRSVGVNDQSRLAAAREESRGDHDRQQAALASWFALDAKADKIRAGLAAVEAEQQAALAQLACLTDARTAGRLTGVPVTQARHAVTQHQQQQNRQASSTGTGTADRAANRAETAAAAVGRGS